MAKISNIPKVGEFLILKTDRTEVDFQVTNVNVSANSYGPEMHHRVTIEGFLHRERMMNSGYTSNTINWDGMGGMYQTTGASFTIGQHSDPNRQMKIKTPSKGMDVDINTIETVDGTKAQIVLYAGSKKVIAWESEAFEDDDDLSAKGAQTADVKAKKAAEGHAKGVLKAVFSQS